MGLFLAEKGTAFTVHVAKVCGEIQKKHHEHVMSKQLLRAGTSVGANLREAEYAESDADFLHKLQIALKECDEADLWLCALESKGFLHDATICGECKELLKMLVTATKKQKRKMGLL